MLEVLQQLGFVPRTAVWELTLACNMNCRHCGSRAGAGREEELSTDEALVVCKDLADLGCKHITFSGGEPLLRKEWPVLAKALTDRGVSVNMISNGHLFSPDVARAALDAGITNMAFSIDGLEETHTFIRRIPGNWAKLMDNFEQCPRLGLSTGAITTILKRNMPELPKLRECLRDLGVGVWQLQLGTPSGNMGDNKALLIDPEDMLELVPLIAELRALPGPRIDVGDNIGYFGGYETALRSRPGDPDDGCQCWLGCNAGCGVVGIESNGNIKGCLSLPSSRNKVEGFVEGNVRQRSLPEIWNDPDAFAYNRKFRPEQLAGFCSSCEYAEFCRGGCSWAAFAHSGSRYESRYCYHRILTEKGMLPS